MTEYDLRTVRPIWPIYFLLCTNLSGQGLYVRFFLKPIGLLIFVRLAIVTWECNFTRIVYNRNAVSPPYRLISSKRATFEEG